MHFVTIAKDNFIDWANTIELAGFAKWEEYYPMHGIELVLVSKLYDHPTLEARVYTTLNPDGFTRDIGEDSIKTLLVDSICGKVIKSYPKILRTVGAFDRLDKRMLQILLDADSVTYCKKCGSHQVQRINRATKEPFMACGAWPNCGTPAPYDLRK